MSGEPSISADEQQLFELLDQYMTSLAGGEGAALDPPAELLEAFPELADVLDCLDTLDSMAAVTLPQTGDQTEALTAFSDGRRSFGRYELLAEIGRGGMGIVFAARQPLLDASVALKVIRSSQFASADEIRRFYAEARAAAGLRHPNIVSVHDVGEWQGQHFLTMDLIRGGTLADSIAQEGPMEPRHAAELLATVAWAVDYLHRNQIVHRDLKPTNILLDDDGNPHVTDFGLAKVFETDGGETTSGTIVGTPGYMSPEQAAGRVSQVSPRSDVYSLGAVLYEMLTGVPPFREENPLDTLLQVLEAEPEPPRRRRPDVPVELEEICLACLEKDPRDRLESAATLAEELTRFLRKEPLRIKPRSVWDRLRRWTRREPALASRLAVVLAGSVIVQGNYHLSQGAIAAREHAEIMVVIGAWLLTCLVCQKLMNRESWEARMPFVWAATDVFFLTSLLVLARPGSSIGPILVGYPLLVVASGLWFEQTLVWFMTAACCVAYLVVNKLRHDPLVPVPEHYPYIYTVVLCGIGYIVAYQVERIRTLSRYFERRR